jgi:hypothetical protein
VPTPDPWSCAACTNSQGCSSYCSGNNLLSCQTYCTGNNNKVCASHCFGNNDTACLDYCQGYNNSCVQNCRKAAGVTLAAEIRPPGFVAAVVAGVARRAPTPQPLLQLVLA